MQKAADIAANGHHGASRGAFLSPQFFYPVRKQLESKPETLEGTPLRKINHARSVLRVGHVHQAVGGPAAGGRLPRHLSPQLPHNVSRNHTNGLECASRSSPDVGAHWTGALFAPALPSLFFKVHHTHSLPSSTVNLSVLVAETDINSEAVDECSKRICRP